MPITRPNVNLYSINNLALDYDPGSGRYGLAWNAPERTPLPCAWEKIFR